MWYISNGLSVIVFLIVILIAKSLSRSKSKQGDLIVKSIVKSIGHLFFNL